MDAINLDTITVEDEVLGAVSSRIARNHHVMPLRFENGRRELVIATESPDDLDTLTELELVLSCRVTPVAAEWEAIQAAIERHYGPRSYKTTISEMLRAIKLLDSRNIIAVARDWLRRVPWRRRLCRVRVGRDLVHVTECPPQVRFANYLLLAVANSGARETIVEFTKAGGRFHFMAADGELVERDIPTKWARRITRRITFMAKANPEHAIPKGRLKLDIHGEPFDYDVTSERMPAGERLVLRLVEAPTPEE